MNKINVVLVAALLVPFNMPAFAVNGNSGTPEAVCLDGSTANGNGNSSVCNDLPPVLNLRGVPGQGLYTVAWDYSWPSVQGAKFFQVERDGVHLMDVPTLRYVDFNPVQGTYVFRVRPHLRTGTGFNTVNHFGPWTSVTVNIAQACASQPAITASVTPAIIWPPNRKMVPVTISGTVAQQPGCSLVGAFYKLTDEYGAHQAGSLTVGPNGGTYSVTVYVEAWRLGTDKDGRTYTFSVSAANQAGPGASSEAVVLVPHDQR
jgi:hypothetical protein